MGIARCLQSFQQPPFLNRLLNPKAKSQKLRHTREAGCLFVSDAGPAGNLASDLKAMRELSRHESPPDAIITFSDVSSLPSSTKETPDLTDNIVLPGPGGFDGGAVELGPPPG